MIFVFLFDKSIVVEVAIKEPRIKKPPINGIDLDIFFSPRSIDDRKSNTDGKNKIEIVKTQV